MDAKQLLSDPDGANENLEITPDVKYSVIQSYLSSETPSKPLVNDSTTSINPFGGTMFYAYRGVIFEVLKNEYLNSVTIFAVNN